MVEKLLLLGIDWIDAVGASVYSENGVGKVMLSPSLQMTNQRSNSEVRN